MIELVQVRVENFRSFEAATFTPASLGDGITAITGPNGAGKSTIIAAVVWALFGVTPDGVNVKGLRRQGSEGPVVAEVTFRHDGQTIQVTRALRGKNDTTIASVTVDGVEQTNVSSRTATAWVVQNIGLDAEAFLTAFVVRQKELDALVRARPADRRKTIERLAGIERMAAAVDLARTAARDAQKVVNAIPAPECTEEEAENLLHTAEKKEAAGETAVTQARATLDTAKDALAVAERALQEATDASRAVEKLGYEFRDAQSQYDAALERHQQLVAAAASADDLPYAQATADAAAEALTDAENHVRQVDTFVRRATDLQDRAKDAETTLTALTQDIDTLTTARGTLTGTLDSVDDTLDDTVAEVQATLSGLREQQGAAKGETARLTQAIQTLSEHHDPSCPTCETPLADPSALVATLNTALTTTTATVADLGKQIGDTQEQLSALVKKQQERDTARQRIATIDDQIAEKQERAQAAQNKLAEIGDVADEAAEEAHAAQLAAENAEQTLPTLREQNTAAQRALRVAEAAAEAAGNLPASEERLTTLQNALTQASDAHARATETAARLDEQTAAAHVRETRDTQTAADRALAELRGALAVAQRDTETARDRLTRVKKATQDRVNALAALEEATATASALDEFRRDRLARLAPELSEIASDIVTQITGGTYTAVELDEDFTPILTDASGEERPAAWLSGGEESAVALALRIAVGEVLSGRKGGLLILDEVLTAQDATRRAATMGALRELPRQIVTINHVAEATDMVDHVISVEPTDTGSELRYGYADEFPDIVDDELAI